VVPKDIKIQATSLTINTIQLGNATATDIQPVTITNNAPKTFPLGLTTITWTATDASGNKANATQTVDVVVRSLPQLTIPQDMLYNATAFETSLNIGQASATGVIDTSPKIINNSTGIFHRKNYHKMGCH
jgi:hypothetical protein